MKFAYFGFDFFVGCLERLLADGHKLVAVFSCECDNKRWDFNERVAAIAREHSVSFSITKPKEDALRELKSVGCDVLVSAAYPFRIPVGSGIPVGLNIHPTLLPKGRGRWPLPHTILQALRRSGVSIHTLTNAWDAGPIVSQCAFDLTSQDDLESLSARVQMLAPELISAVCADLAASLSAARPQEEGEAYLQMPTDVQRTLNFFGSVEDIDRTVRAFGKFGSYAKFDDAEWLVSSATVWRTPHGFELGSVVHRMAREVVLAAQDGFVCLKNFELDPDFVATEPKGSQS